jgi:hypothetical protein
MTGPTPDGHQPLGGLVRFDRRRSSLSVRSECLIERVDLADKRTKGAAHAIGDSVCKRPKFPDRGS